METNREQSEDCGPAQISQERQLRIVFVRANNYDCTPAIPRALEASKGIFSETSILCWNRSGKCKSEDISVDGARIRQFVRIAPQRSFRIVLLTLWYQAWLFWNLLRLQSDVIQVCSVVSGLPAGIVAMLTRRRLIYDVRDPFALCYRFPLVVKMIAYAVDWCVMGFSSAFVVPTSRYIPYMGRWGNSGREILEIPNTCHDLLDQLPSVREILPSKKDGIIRLAYMGYLDASRGSRWLLDFCGAHSNKVELVVAGDCRSKELAAELQSTPNAIYVGRLPYERALSLMREMDAVTIFCDLGKPSYRIADPTKFYDAMMVGTPVLVTAGTSIDRLVLENRLGYVLEHNSMGDLCKAVKELRNPKKTASMRARCRRYYLDNLRLSKKLVGYRQFYSEVTNQWFTDKT